MIILTRLDGERLGINDEQIERIEETPTTVLTLVNGNKYTVLERLDEVIDAIVSFRAAALQRAGSGVQVSSPPAERRPATVTHLVPLPDQRADGAEA